MLAQIQAFFVRFSGGWKCQKPQDYWVFEQFLWVFWRFSWVFGQNCWVFDKIYWVFTKNLYLSKKKHKILQFCVALWPWKVNFFDSRHIFWVFVTEAWVFPRKFVWNHRNIEFCTWKPLSFFRGLSFFRLEFLRKRTKKSLH